MAIRATLLLFAVVACGCVLPLPHWSVYAPGVDGRVVDRDQGFAIIGAEVSDPYGYRITVSDSTGAFSVPPQRQFRLFLIFLGVYSSSWWPGDRPASDQRELRISALGYGTRYVVVLATKAPTLPGNRVRAVYKNSMLEQAVIQLPSYPDPPGSAALRK